MYKSLGPGRTSTSFRNREAPAFLDHTRNSPARYHITRGMKGKTKWGYGRRREGEKNFVSYFRRSRRPRSPRLGRGEKLALYIGVWLYYATFLGPGCERTARAADYKICFFFFIISLLYVTPKSTIKLISLHRFFCIIYPFSKGKRIPHISFSSLSVCVCMCVCLCMNMCVCKCVQMYIYIYIYICMYNRFILSRYNAPTHVPLYLYMYLCKYNITRPLPTTICLFLIKRCVYVCACVCVYFRCVYSIRIRTSCANAQYSFPIFNM